MDDRGFIKDFQSEQEAQKAGFRYLLNEETEGVLRKVAQEDRVATYKSMNRKERRKKKKQERKARKKQS